MVVIDWPAMMGKSAIQLADYAAMRTFAKTRPVGGGGRVDTILALFDADSTAPAELSETDLAYLTSLYAMPGTRYAPHAARHDFARHAVRRRRPTVNFCSWPGNNRPARAFINACRGQQVLP